MQLAIINTSGNLRWNEKRRGTWDRLEGQEKQKFQAKMPQHYSSQVHSNRIAVAFLLAWLIGWLVGCLIGWLVGWSVGRLVGWSVGRLVGWSVGRLVGWLVGWLIDWLIESCPSKRSQAALRYWFGPSSPLVLVMANWHWLVYSRLSCKILLNQWACTCFVPSSFSFPLNLSSVPSYSLYFSSSIFRANPNWILCFWFTSDAFRRQGNGKREVVSRHIGLHRWGNCIWSWLRLNKYTLLDGLARNAGRYSTSCSYFSEARRWARKNTSNE